VVATWGLEDAGLRDDANEASALGSETPETGGSDFDDDIPF